MRTSGWQTLLLLLISALIVFVVVQYTVGGFDELRARLSGEPKPEPAQEVTAPRSMSTGDGMQQVEQTKRDLETQDSLANSVWRTGH